MFGVLALNAPPLARHARVTFRTIQLLSQMLTGKSTPFRFTKRLVRSRLSRIAPPSRARIIRFLCLPRRWLWEVGCLRESRRRCKSLSEACQLLTLQWAGVSWLDIAAAGGENCIWSTRQDLNLFDSFLQPHINYTSSLLLSHRVWRTSRSQTLLLRYQFSTPLDSLQLCGPLHIILSL